MHRFSLTGVGLNCVEELRRTHLVTVLIKQ